MWRFRWLAFILACSVLTSPASAQAHRRVALVVGNSAYQHTTPLTNPKNDANDIGAALRKHGFEVVQGFDLDKAAFDRKIRAFAEMLPGASAAVFFYAGHGLQVGGQNYLVPIDATLITAASLDFEMIRLELVHRSMEREAGTNIMFVDACRNNPLARNLARAMGTRSVEIGHGLAPVEAGVGTLVSFSTQPGNVALDGKGRNSPFAGALVRHIASSNDDLSALLIGVRNDVMKETQRQQVPWEHSALTGKFYFSAPPAPAPKGPPADEIAWSLIKDAKDPGLLRRFIEQFPESKRRTEAEHRAASLTAIPKPADPPPQPASKPASATPPVPAAPPPRPDEVAWSLIKDTKDPDLLRRFVAQFPESKRRADAEKRAAGLAEAAKSAERPSPPPKQPATGGSKCFSFDGRQFCQ
jgi:hypothetical protein